MRITDYSPPTTKARHSGTLCPLSSVLRPLSPAPRSTEQTFQLAPLETGRFKHDLR
jgi:hypothetical protein